MDLVRLLATLLPLSVSSGLNLYATVLVAGLSIRFGWVQNTPQSLDVLASWPVIIIAAVLFIVEMFVDKVPFIDNLWDLIQTPIRPLGAALIAFAALGHASPVVMIVASLAAGGLALVSHGGKAGGRVALNVASPAENFTNIFVSMVEDAVAAGLSFIALKYPYEATVAALVLLGLVILIVPPLFRWAVLAVLSIIVWIKALVQRLLRKATRPDELPAAHVVLLGHRRPEIASRCYAQNIRGASGKGGYLALLDDELVFTYDTWFGARAWRMPRRRAIAGYLARRVAMDVLQVQYRDDKGKERIARFAFLKDRTNLAEEIASRLGAPSTASSTAASVPPAPGLPSAV